MRLLIIHPEAKYFAGAERMLGYFLRGLIDSPLEVSVALAREGKLAELIPNRFEQILIPDHGQFSISSLTKQLRHLRRRHEEKPFDVIHGWAARDWELTALTGRLARRPAVGTLHDHPRARFISWKRRSLMRWCARWGLRKVVCVSEAVRSACFVGGYPPHTLEVIHNGLPGNAVLHRCQKNSIFRFGFLGTFSERKGLHTLFAMVAELAALTDAPWELRLAGGAQDASGKRMLAQIQNRFSGTNWWKRIHWSGWVEQPTEFLQTLDLLVVPSAEFDPFPTVLLEAASVGVPALAARVGGVPEIVDDGETGWLFDSDHPQAAAEMLRRAIERPDQCRQLGKRALAKAVEQFTVGKMVAQYLNLYSNLLTDV